MKRHVLVLMITAATAFALSCGSNEESSPVSPQKKESALGKLVKVYTIEPRRMEEKLELPGTIEPENAANILSTTEGKISKLLVREGDKVKQNQVVAYISSLVREDIINSARLLVEAKRKELAENPNDFQLKKELEQAEEDYQFALHQYKEIPIISPISGVISKRWVDIGDMIPAKTKLFEIQSGERLLVKVSVSELDVRKLNIGQKAQIRADACPGKIFEGIVQRVYPQINEKTRNGLAEIKLINPCPNLRAGMFVRTIFITRTLENTIAVPIESVIDRPQNRTCFIARDGKAEERVIKTGLEAERWVEILEGLKIGDIVVIEGQEQLKTGTSVRIQEDKKKTSLLDGGQK